MDWTWYNRYRAVFQIVLAVVLMVRHPEFLIGALAFLGWGVERFAQDLERYK